MVLSRLPDGAPLPQPKGLFFEGNVINLIFYAVLSWLFDIGIELF
jgi:hypothetical protein